MAMIDRNFTFATNGTVTANDLHNLIDSATIYQDLITGQLPITSVGTNYELLIADGTNPNAAPNAVTVYDLFEDALTAGTYTNANISAALTYGTATGTRLVSTNATITTGTITTAVIPTLTAGTTTSTAATITSGTITNLASTTGTIATLNSTTGTIATLNSTTGTVATLNSTTGTITNLSTTLAGDFTISSGTGTLGTTGVTAGTYGSVTAIPFLTVDAKGRITSATTGTFSSTPADGSITPAKLSQPITLETAKAYNWNGLTTNTSLDFTGIPSWVARIMVTFGGVSVSGTSPFLVQLGTGAGPTFTSSGYTSIGISFGGSGLTSTAKTNGFAFADTVNALYAYGGNAVIAKVSGNIYSFNSTLAAATTSGDGSCVGAGSVSLGAVLTSIRITTAGSANTFDGGTINIMYEG